MGLSFLFASLNSFTNPLIIMYNSRSFRLIIILPIMYIVLTNSLIIMIIITHSGRRSRKSVQLLEKIETLVENTHPLLVRDMSSHFSCYFGPWAPSWAHL